VHNDIDRDGVWLREREREKERVEKDNKGKDKITKPLF
jgi:hypothetical protein